MSDVDDQIRPEHYTGLNPEPIEVIEAWGLLDSFCLANVIKYVSRAGRKGDPLGDLQKAAWYLDYEIKRRQGGDHAAD